MSAAKAEILKKIHRPVWNDRILVSKTSWVGSLECMQYYATVSANDTLDGTKLHFQKHLSPFLHIDVLFFYAENIMWLSVDNIQEKDAGSTVIADLPDLPHLVGSGQSVGGVVSETVGAGNINENTPLQVGSSFEKNFQPANTNIDGYSFSSCNVSCRDVSANFFMPDMAIPA